MTPLVVTGKEKGKKSRKTVLSTWQILKLSDATKARFPYDL